MKPNRQAARDVLTVTLAISAGVHAALAPEHWRERPALGVGFALAAVAAAAAAVWVQSGNRHVAVDAAWLLLAGLIALYMLSRTRGLPLTGTEEWDAVGVATQVVQLLGLVLATTVHTRHATRGGSHADAHA